MLKRKTLAFILMLIFSCSAVAGCGKSSGKPPADEDFGGTHTDDTKPTNFFVLKDGKTNYKLVLPAAATHREEAAAEEFALYFFEATGILLPVVSDAAVTYSETAEFISVGATSLANAAGVEYGSLGSDGFRISTKGRTVFVGGKNDYGTQYGTYELMRRMLGFEYYYTDFYTLNLGVSDIPLDAYAVVSIPDFPERYASYGYVIYDEAVRASYRQKYYDTWLLVGPPRDQRYMHNEDNWLMSEDPSDPDDISHHPKWWAPTGETLCYTARGDAAERAWMLRKAVKSLKEALARNPDTSKIYAPMTILDTQNCCGCGTCGDAAAEYGAPSGAVIKLLNEISAEIREWFETAEGTPYKRDLKIVFFAYHATSDPPKPEKLRCDPMLLAWYAPLHADFTRSFEHSVNMNFRNQIAAWGKVTDAFMMYLYQTNFTEYLVPYDVFDGIQETYKLCARSNTMLMYDSAQEFNPAPTGWSILKGYLSAKLQWNLNSDLTALTKQFFSAFYGPAADAMYDFHIGQRLHLAQLKAGGIYGGGASVYQQSAGVGFWPKGMLLGWMDDVDRALAAIAPLQSSNPALYASYYNHIAIERLSLLYLLMENYSSSTSYEDFLQYRHTFKGDATTAGLESVGQRGQFSGLLQLYWSDWGI
ncbi:MAG: DUF4838 domain-containing protein [Firmicutes bacterium]|nr:DUF4838 domain-containing protein [Bacillota bacterium]